MQSVLCSDVLVFLCVEEGRALRATGDPLLACVATFPWNPVTELRVFLASFQTPLVLHFVPNACSFCRATTSRKSAYTNFLGCTSYFWFCDACEALAHRARCHLMLKQPCYIDTAIEVSVDGYVGWIHGLYADPLRLIVLFEDFVQMLPVDSFAWNVIERLLPLVRHRFA
jgi:hypothetical protein